MPETPRARRPPRAALGRPTRAALAGSGLLIVAVEARGWPTTGRASWGGKGSAALAASEISFQINISSRWDRLRAVWAGEGGLGGVPHHRHVGKSLLAEPVSRGYFPTPAVPPPPRGSQMLTPPTRCCKIRDTTRKMDQKARLEGERGSASGKFDAVPDYGAPFSCQLFLPYSWAAGVGLKGNQDGCSLAGRVLSSYSQPFFTPLSCWPLPTSRWLLPRRSPREEEAPWPQCQ